MAAPTPDIAIIGGGIIGCAIARALALGGAGRVVVLERGQTRRRGVRRRRGRARRGQQSRAARRAVRSQARQRGAVPGAGAQRCARRPGSTSSTRPPACSISPSPAATPSSSTAWWRAAASRASRSSCWTPSACANAAPRGEPRGAPRRVVCRRPRDQQCAPGRGAARVGAGARRGVPARRRGDADRCGRRGGWSAVDAGGERLAPGHLIIAAGAWSAAVGALLGAQDPGALRPRRDGRRAAARSPLP